MEKIDPPDLITWLKMRPIWVQESAHRLITKGKLAPTDDVELIEFCKKEAASKKTGAPMAYNCPLKEGGIQINSTANVVRLNSMSEPKGIDELNPKKSLILGASPLTIVYGPNGSGKSGYIRILKQACGGRAPRQLRGNVFDSSTPAQSCRIDFSINGVTQNLVWEPRHGVHQDLSYIEIYDTDAGRLYTTQENEVLYEPPILAILQALIVQAGKLDSLLLQEISALPSAKPNLPPEYQQTSASAWYANLQPKVDDSNIDQACGWSAGDEEKLNSLRKRLAEANPSEEAAKLRKRKEAIVTFLDAFNKIYNQLDEASVNKIHIARLDATTKRKTANEDAQKVFSQAPLDGVGADSWKLLWDAARKYSTEYAYKDVGFPNVSTGAKCILCQQELDGNSKIRMTSFEAYVKGVLETDAKKSEDELKSLVDRLPILDTPESFPLKLSALSIIDETQVALWMSFNEQLILRKKAIVDALPVPALPDKSIFSGLMKITSDLEFSAKQFDDDAKKGGRDAVQAEVRELSAKKWLSEFKTAIREERNRLSAIQDIEAARRLLNTKALSDKKSALTTVIITDEYIKRFQEEMSVLGGKDLKVILAKTSATKGQVKHQIQLDGASANARPNDILSEGEQRIISIAAFLAESEGIGNTTPFIFDDPISSLDQEFEEKTVTRLVELSKRRQVVVFTHRISLLCLLQDVAKAEKVDVTVTSLQREPWGSGEPSQPPLFSMRPDKVINVLLDSRLSVAKKIYLEKGNAAYYHEARAICGDIRVTVERLVEHTLFNEVVLRFRRSVQTYNRLDKVGKIKPEDCKFLDDFMTEYSKYEHSQPGEIPLNPPNPDKLEEDLKKLKSWQADFISR